MREGEMEREGSSASPAYSSGKRSQQQRSITMEQIFELQEIPTWKEQLTVRAFVVSAILGIFFNIIVMKLNLTTGIIPSLNVPAGLLAYFMVRIWVNLLHKTGLLKQPFTRQENTVVQTCVVAISGVAYSGGFGSHTYAMSSIIAGQLDKDIDFNNVKDPSLDWMIPLLATVSFIGLFAVLPLTKVMIIDHKLIYPSGTATAHLINGFHTPQGAKLVKKQVSVLFKTFTLSLLWAFFQWFFTAGPRCGFRAFPTFGLHAYKQTFYFDFSATYVGVGMMCPYIVNISLLVGSIFAWGIMGPYLDSMKGEWYSEKLTKDSINGLQGYMIFMGISMITGEGFFQFAVMLVKTIRVISSERQRRESASTLLPDDSFDGPSLSYDELRRKEVFLQDHISLKSSLIGYISFAAISIITIPYLFPQLRWYHILVAYTIAPVFGFCNSYGCGLTDCTLASSYGKLAIIIFGAWVGSNGGVIAGLASCTLIMSIVQNSSDLMHDFKTAYLTLTSPRAMIISQLIGVAMGCIIAPSVFWIFYTAFPIGIKGSDYPTPYAVVYRGIALLSADGFANLPKHCVLMCIITFLVSFFISAAKESMKNSNCRLYYYLPSITAMSIPFFLGSNFTIDMCIGSLILYVWERKDFRHAEAFAPAVAAGMICGDGIWTLPQSILAISGITPPICMKFLSYSDNAIVDELLLSRR